MCVCGKIRLEGVIRGWAGLVGFTGCSRAGRAAFRSFGGKILVICLQLSCPPVLSPYRKYSTVLGLLIIITASDSVLMMV